METRRYQKWLAAAVVLVAAGLAMAVTWDGGGNDGKWCTCANWWMGNECPGCDDIVNIYNVTDDDLTVTFDCTGGPTAVTKIKSLFLDATGQGDGAITLIHEDGANVLQTTGGSCG